MYSKLCNTFCLLYLKTADIIFHNGGVHKIVGQRTFCFAHLLDTCVDLPCHRPVSTDLGAKVFVDLDEADGSARTWLGQLDARMLLAKELRANLPGAGMHTNG